MMSKIDDKDKDLDESIEIKSDQLDDAKSVESSKVEEI